LVEDDDRDLDGRLKHSVEDRSTVCRRGGRRALHRLLLSGGTDSSTAPAVDAVRRKPVRAYSIASRPQVRRDGYARTAARHFGLEHREYYLTPDDLVSAIPNVAASYDQPFGNSSVLARYSVR